MATIENIITQPYLKKADKEALVLTEKDIKDYNTAVKDAIEMLSIDLGMANPMLSVTDEFYVKISKSLSKISEVSDKENRESHQEALSKIDNTLNLLYVLVVVSLIIVIFLIIGITKSIKIHC